MKIFFRFLLKIGGWKGVGGELPDDKCIVIGVPHTSNWDFFWSWVFYKSVGGQANFLVKKEAFFWPVGYLIRKMGGVPIDRSKGANVVMQVVGEFEKRKRLQLAITPEGTRKKTARWKGGFHQIAKMADVPVFLGVFDYGKREIGIIERFELTDDVQADLLRMRRAYKNVVAKHPDKFTVGKID